MTIFTAKKRLREIDPRMRYLMKRLEIADIVDPTKLTGRNQVFFGAMVTFANERDAERTVRIVGIDEADLARGDVSLHAPIARALMHATCGETPTGREPVEIIGVRYI